MPSEVIPKYSTDLNDAFAAGDQQIGEVGLDALEFGDLRLDRAETVGDVTGEVDSVGVGSHRCLLLFALLIKRLD
jgi:hypothetical protein